MSSGRQAKVNRASSSSSRAAAPKRSMFASRPFEEETDTTEADPFNTGGFIAPKLDVEASPDRPPLRSFNLASLPLYAPTPVQRQEESEEQELEESEIQAKLTIGQPGDQYEQEADRMAAQVMRMPEAEEEEAQQQPIADQVSLLLQRKEGDRNAQAGAEFEQQLAGQQGGGQPLPDELKSSMESKFQSSFDRVRVHTNSAAVQMNKEVGAQAFTHGSDIYFNSGKYSPGSSGGQELLAHELTHTIQQTGGVQAKSDRAQPIQRLCSDCEAEQEEIQAKAMPGQIAEEIAQPEKPDAALPEDEQAQVNSPAEAIDPASLDAAETNSTDQLHDKTPPALDRAAEESEPQPQAEANQSKTDQKNAADGERSPAPPQPQSASADAPPTPEPKGKEKAAPEQTNDPKVSAAPAETQAIAEKSQAEAINQTAAVASQTETEASAVETAEAEAIAVQSDAQQLAATDAQFAPQPPQAMFATTPEGLSLFQPETVLGATSNNLILFQTEHPEAMQATAQAGSTAATEAGIATPTPVLQPIPETDAAAITAQQQQQASAALSQFVAVGSARLSSISGLGQMIQPRIEAASVQAKASLDAAIGQNQAAVTGSIAQARSQVQAQVSTARNQVTSQHSSTVSAIQAATATARQRVETEYTTSLDQLVQLEQDINRRVDEPFAKAAQDSRTAGQQVGQEAVAIGARYRNQYMSEPLPEVSEWDKLKDGEDYHQNRRQAKADAATQTATQFKEQLETKANEYAGQLPNGKQSAIDIFQQQITEARTQLEAKRQAALAGLTQAEQQSIVSADSTRTAQLQSIDQQLTASVGSLDQLEATQIQQLAEAGNQQKLALDQNQAQAIAVLQDGVTQATTNLQTTFDGLVGEATAIEAPNLAMLNSVFAEAQTQLGGAVTQTQTELEASIKTSEDGMLQTSQQAVGNLNSIAQQTQSQSATLAQNFAASMTEATQSATQTLTQLQASHTTTVNTQAEAAVSGLKQQISGVRQTFDRIGQNLTTQLDKNVHELQTGLQGTIKDLPGTIETKAQEAADKVQPRWKGILKVVVPILIDIATFVAIAALIAASPFTGGASLVAAIAIGAAVGAAGGLLKQAANDLIDGKMSSWQDYAKSAGLGAISGALAAVGIKGADKLVGAVGNRFLQFGARALVESSADTADNVIQNLASGQQFSVQMVAEAAAIALVTTVAGEGISKLFGKLRSPNVDVKAPDLDVKAPDIDVKAPDADVKAPDADVKAPEVDSTTPELKPPGTAPNTPNLETRPPDAASANPAPRNADGTADIRNTTPESGAAREASVTESGRVESNQLSDRQIKNELDHIKDNPNNTAGIPPNRKAKIGEHEWQEQPGGGWCRHSNGEVCVPSSNAPENATQTIQQPNNATQTIQQPNNVAPTSVKPQTARQKKFEAGIQERVSDGRIDSEMAGQLREYNRLNPYGTLTADEVFDRFKAGKRLNEDGLFYDPSLSSHVDKTAIPSRERPVSHDDISSDSLKEIKAESRKRKRAQADRDQAKERYLEPDGTYHDDYKIDESYKAGQQSMIEASERMGEKAATAAIQHRFPGARPLKSKTAGGKQGEFDMVFENGDGVLIIGEAKGGGAGRGSRRTADQIRVEQGTPEYRDDIVRIMEEEAARTGDLELQETVDKIRRANRAGKLQYLQLAQRVDKQGNLVPEVEVDRFSNTTSIDNPRPPPASN